MRVIYNRRLNEKPRIFKFFTPWELLFLIIALVAPTIVANMFGWAPSFIDSIIMLALYMMFILRFKLGRPEGYFVHWMKHWHIPKHFRPGHWDPPSPIYYDQEPTPTRKDVAATELILFEEQGLAYIDSGKCILRSALTPELEEEFYAALLKGDPISLEEK